ncbi:GTPase HflX [Salibacteraceae bacterium]|nr:GTPase HflX [Salibacteraceae bacterium]
MEENNFLESPARNPEERDDAVLIGLIQRGQTDEEVDDYLKELEFLALTAGFRTKKVFIQRLDVPHVKTFVGSGKLQEIIEDLEEHKIKYAIFDDDLSPSQLRNLEKSMKVQIFDRSLLILDIFQQRAQTAQAKTQVQLAKYEYLLPRLTRMWTHLERQRGGTGTRGGAGEKEIETDRRIIRSQISVLKERLKKIDKQMMTQRKNRGRLIRVSLVGYTNAGKSTLMNLLSKSKVLAEDKLFATLDTTVRKVVLGNLPFLLSDTVGFIRKLPHSLVESFKSTLDEARESDILLHVVDVSHPNFEEHIKVVQRTLHEIGAGDIPVIMVFNKTDLYRLEDDEFDLTGEVQARTSLTALRKAWTKEGHKVLFVSAKKKSKIDEMRNLLYDEVKAIHLTRYPYDKLLY